MRYVVSYWKNLYVLPLHTVLPFLWMARFARWFYEPFYSKVEIWDTKLLRRL